MDNFDHVNAPIVRKDPRAIMVTGLTLGMAAGDGLPPEFAAVDPAVERLKRQVPRGVVARPHGRNDPCPCGSGKKFKRCCIGKRPAIEARPVEGAPALPVEDDGEV